MHQVARMGWTIGVLLAVLCAGCGDPVGGTKDATAGEDAVTDEDGGAVDGGDTTADSAGDAAADAAVGPDNGGDAKVTKDTTVVLKGCLKDSDCVGLALTTCQLPACATATGLCQVTNLPDDTTCPNAVGDLCKVNAKCAAGLCKYQLKSCDDGNPCTDEGCGSGSGCTKDKGKPKLCVDGSPCSLNASCLDGVCKSQTPVKCDDKLPCTVDTCDVQLGCVHGPAGDESACDDGLICTSDDACKKGKCLGTTVVCKDDGNPCTVVACVEVPKLGCSNNPMQQPVVCDDDKPCTTKDTCSGTTCSGIPDTCDDKNPCSDDSCDATLGCVNKDNDKPCAGSDACAVTGVCKAGACKLVPASCDDGNLCTVDSCDKALGCQNKTQPAPCFDGSVCTENDTCDNGTCKPGTPLDCDDKDPCMADTCDASKGCSHAAASYGTPCGTGKQCAVGLCLPDDCGDGWCAPSENATSCDQDCPTTGGECPAADAPCLTSCQAAKCTAPDNTCKAAAGCPGIGTCLSACGSDLNCQIGCIKVAASAAFQAFSSFDQCLQAFCVQDFWLGKKCTGAGINYGTCVDACESAMCKLLWLQCKASTGCTAVRNCLQACNGAEDPAKLVACIADCKTKGTAEDLLKNADLDTCSSGYCQ